METKLIFLFFFLCLSETKPVTLQLRLDTTFNDIIEDLQMLATEDPNNFTSFSCPVRKCMTCTSTSKEVLEQLNVNLKNISVDRISTEENRRILKRVKKNVNELRHAFQKGQMMTGELHCPKALCRKDRLMAFIKILQLVNKRCSFSEMQ